MCTSTYTTYIATKNHVIHVYYIDYFRYNVTIRCTYTYSNTHIHTYTHTYIYVYHQYRCPVCEREITEAQVNSEGEGTQDEDAVFCKGLCQKWFHCTCCSLACDLFVPMGKSNVPFMCYNCMSSKQRDEISFSC